ncbi:acyltransferase family protein [Amycolatopsis suaedae]|uniref:acyltransferase family protein n=1 Tax=Amycolatopsis suaedae TaxID=2510978 RepID=UPI001F0F4F00|nr:acyltransferase [Amycolatopsis suaedae]
MDWLRAVSLLVVVVWHWAFTILRWTPDGPQPTSPLGFLSGLWPLTWLLQVLPMFFYVGGFAHLTAWRRAEARGEGLREFVWAQVRRLVWPAAILVAVWGLLGLTLGQFFDARWVGNTVMLVLSPLWFLGVYVGLLLLLPLSLWSHRRFGVLTLVWLAGTAMVVDVLRFRYGLDWAGWINLVVVWGLAHQTGFFYRDIVDSPRRWDLSLMSAGLFGLAGLVLSGLYPGSMVGVPGDRMSNMAPPTFAIVALLLFQAGLAEVVRPGMEKLLEKPRWQRFCDLANRYALPLFLFHTTGMALARALHYLVVEGGIVDDREPDLVWWLQRPLAVLLPLLFTVVAIAAFGLSRRRPA